MSYLKERVSYLKGLAEGMQISDSTNEGKLLKAMLEVMDDFALAVEDLEEVQDRVAEQVDTIDEDLADIERLIFEEDEYEDDSEDDEYISEFACPYCSERIKIDADIIDEDDESIKCPHCGKNIEVEWDCSCEECDGAEHQ